MQKTLLDRVDLNHDGKIDVREFTLLMRELAPKPKKEEAKGPSPLLVVVLVAALAGAAVFLAKNKTASK